MVKYAVQLFFAFFAMGHKIIKINVKPGDDTYWVENNILKNDKKG